MTHKDLPPKWKLKITDYLRDNGKETSELNTHDFELPIIDIKFEGGSFLEIQRALVIDASEFGEVLIFTEDSKYHIFNSSNISINIIDPENEKDFLIQKLQERNKELKQFIPTVAHDLKGPLRIIKGFSSLLQKDSAQFSKTHQKCIDFIVKSCIDTEESMLKHLDNVITPYKRYELECVDLTEILSDVKKDLAGKIEDARIVIDAPDDSPRVLEQKATLFMLFRDFISIAIQYKKTDEEKASVLIDWEDHNNEYVKISIKYKDVGIEKSYRERTRDSGSYGLFGGPSSYTNIFVRVYKKNIRQEGGEIWIEPEKGIYTIFFTLKLYK